MYKRQAALVLETLAAYEGTKVNIVANGHAGTDGENKYQNLQITIQAQG